MGRRPVGGVGQAGAVQGGGQVHRAATIGAWFVALVLGALGLLWLAGITLDPLHAAIQGVTPLLTLPAVLVLVVAIWWRRWLLTGLAVFVLVVQTSIVAPAVLARTSVPAWATHVEHVSIAVANIRFKNPDLEPKARQLLGTDADILIVVELTPAFAQLLDRLGAERRYRYRVSAPHTRGAGGIGLYSKRPLHDAGFQRIGSMRVPSARIRAGRRDLRIFGLHLRAPATDQAVGVWEDQLGALAHQADRVRGPTVFAGDLNATRFHPELARLLDHDLSDAHEAMGLPFAGSWPSNSGIRSLLGPVMQLDHALVTDDVAVTGLEQLDAAGSDHRGFVVTLAVRPPGHG
jgi:endonuclease/exonuclease/phosphatase (EEP) superfamily protein YafD